MDGDCRECRAGLDHCHGTLIIHAQRRTECTEDSCDVPEIIAHALRIDCDAVGCACGQTIAVAV
jgi:hypothetical protein